MQAEAKVCHYTWNSGTFCSIENKRNFLEYSYGGQQSILFDRMSFIEHG